MGSDQSSDVGRRTSERQTSDGRRTAEAPGYSSPTSRHAVVRLNGTESETLQVSTAAEVPVALVYNGRPYAVMMCTPADLDDFGVGFTVTERIASPGDVRRIDVVRYARGIELQIEIAAAAADRMAERGRAVTGRTGCGLCGVETIGEALWEPPPVRSALRVAPASLWRAGEALGANQPLNRDTNAIHAAAWATASGDVVIAREDVGRHNALDKVIGALLRGQHDASQGFLVVTSRASYELVQKCASVGIPILAAVSRATTLAVDIADRTGITLVGLLRGSTANVYTHPERIA